MNYKITFLIGWIGLTLCQSCTIPSSYSPTGYYFKIKQKVNCSIDDFKKNLQKAQWDFNIETKGEQKRLYVFIKDIQVAKTASSITIHLRNKKDQITRIDGISVVQLRTIRSFKKEVLTSLKEDIIVKITDCE